MFASTNANASGGAGAIGILKEKMATLKRDNDILKDTNEELRRELKVKDDSMNKLEGDTAGLQRRIQLLEEDLERSEERLTSAQEKLDLASKAADESERSRRTVENKLVLCADHLEETEHALCHAKQLATDAETRCDEAARKLVVIECELEKSESKSENFERKVKTLEEDSHVLGNSLKALEQAKLLASQREDSYEESIRDLTQRLKDAENRSTEAERTVSKLQKEVDRLEDELNNVQSHNTQLLQDMNQCIEEIKSL